MKVSAVIPTRGNVDMTPIVEALACFDEVLIWDNSKRQNLSVYGRYAMIAEARNELIWTQDDDVIVSDPQMIVDALMLPKSPADWKFQKGEIVGWSDSESAEARESYWCDRLVANMPQEFRHDGYTDSCLVGFGACFHRDLPARAFDWYARRQANLAGIAGSVSVRMDLANSVFLRTCDVVFTTLTPRVLVDVPKIDREFASDQDRMWRQPDHVGERTRMLELARVVRDG